MQLKFSGASRFGGGLHIRVRTQERSTIRRATGVGLRAGAAGLWFAVHLSAAAGSAYGAANGLTGPPDDHRGASLVVRADGGSFYLALRGGPAFYATRHRIVDARLIDVPGEAVRLALWAERADDGHRRSYYAVSLDSRRFSRVRPARYELELRGGGFDPVLGVPEVPAVLRADARCRLYIVQFITQPLEAFRRQLAATGATALRFLANNANIVRMDPDVAARVAALPCVRWVGPFHPAYRLEEYLRARAQDGPAALPPARYNILVAERGPRYKAAVADRITRLGGTVVATSAEGLLIEATLTAAQLVEVVHWNEVLFVDRWFPPQSDMDIVREMSGANYVESVAGYTGQGVRLEVMDTNFVATHPDLASHAFMFHGPHDDDADHGTSVMGILFGDGGGDARARGLLPGADGIFADFEHLVDRHAHTAELLHGPYFAVYQTNSWGNGGTTDYTNQSADFDDVLFRNDILVCQSQSNNGDRRSRVQAWAKNVVSVGGINHQNTPDRSDDRWNGDASIGPAADGRIKPDLVHVYDAVYTLAQDGGYRNFCCTSAATAITAGYFGLFFQMWHDGIFGNPTAGTVFHSRPHMTTAKAMMINTAYRYPFTGLDDDLTRTHQGWGMADLRRMYDERDRLFIVDETDVLENLGAAHYTLTVPPGEPMLRATLVYADPPGVPFSSVHRVNDLTLRVTSPDGTIYYGNNGLLEGNVSQPGGEPNTIDTVENVFLEEPPPGTWVVEVLADEINEDSHLETEAVDADFALVVGGVTRPRTAYSYFDDDGDGDVDIDDFEAFGACYSGPAEAAGFDELRPGCSPADCDRDGDVDLIDYACFARSFTGDCGTRLIDEPQDQAGCDGDTIAWQVQSTGTDVHYQWLRDGVPIADTDAPLLTIEPATHDDEGVYSVVAWTRCGIARSRGATLTVPLPPFGFIWPTRREVCLGAPVSIDAYVRGADPLALQWQIDGVDIPGATAVPLVIDAVGQDDFGSYRVIVMDDCGLGAVSNWLELVSKNVAFNKQPVGGDVCIGGALTLSVEARGSPAFQWYKDGVALVGEQHSFLLIDDAVPDDAGLYHVTATNECNAVTSQDALVTVSDCGGGP